MTVGFPQVPIGELARPVERPVRPIPGHSYRQLGVRLWGEGAYERETIDGGETRYAVLSRVATGDIVVNKIWARNGSVAVVPALLEGCYVSGEFPTFQCVPDRLDPGWFHWITRTRWFWDRCDSEARGTSGKNRIRPERFLAIRVPAPPLSEQRRVVARIERVLRAVGEAKLLASDVAASIRKLEAAHRDHDYRAASLRFGCRPLSELCLSITDGDHQGPMFTEDGVPFIFVGNVSSGRLHFVGSRFVAADYFSRLSSMRKPVRGDVLYSAVGATLGIPAIVDVDDSFCFQRHVAIIRPDRHLLEPRFLWHVLLSTTLHSLAWDATTGTAQPTVPLRAIKSLPVPAAPVDVQSRMVAHLDDLQGRVEALKALHEKTAAELDALMPSILDKAFRGEL